jgi:hypothetical protein
MLVWATPTTGPMKPTKLGEIIFMKNYMRILNMHTASTPEWEAVEKYSFCLEHSPTLKALGTCNSMI